MREDRYFIAGRAIAVSLVHGGPPPCFLSKALFACIAEGPDACRPVLEDITDTELYSKLKQVCREFDLAANTSSTVHGYWITTDMLCLYSNIPLFSLFLTISQPGF